jgi:hypothetical protein
MASGKVGLHLLSREQLHVSFGFCLASGRVQDKFSALAVRDNGGGPPLFAECLALLDCRVVDWWDVGDRIFFAVEPFAGLNYGPGEPATEADLLAAATPDQLRLLRLNMEDDLRIQRPLREGWRASIARR